MGRKTFRAFIVALSFLLLTGCSQGEAITSDIQSFIKGDVTGELNKNYSTQWFDFNIKDIRVESSYSRLRPYDGYKYVIVTVTETNTFDESVPMSAFDFELGAEGLSEEDSVPYEAFNDRMMPDDFYLDIGETVEYELVYSIPEDIMDITLTFIEVDIYDHVGATFTINHTLPLSVDEMA